MKLRFFQGKSSKEISETNFYVRQVKISQTEIQLLSLSRTTYSGCKVTKHQKTNLIATKNDIH